MTPQPTQPQHNPSAMNAPTFADASAFISGTSLVGQVQCTYNQLIAAFGQPHQSEANGDGLDRITVEWAIRTYAGILTLCDRSVWDGSPTITDRPIWWDIGGNADEHADKALHPVVALVHELIDAPVKDSRPLCRRPAHQSTYSPCNSMKQIQPEPADLDAKSDVYYPSPEMIEATEKMFRLVKERWGLPPEELEELAYLAGVPLEEIKQEVEEVNEVKQA